MANLESVLTYEGTEEVHTITIGKELTGEHVFAKSPPRCLQRNQDRQSSPGWVLEVDEAAAGLKSRRLVEGNSVELSVR